DQCEVKGNATQGVSVNGGSVAISRSEIVNNSGGGIVVDGGGTLVLTNSFVGGDINNVPALHVVDGTADVLYSTLGAGFGVATALTCEDGTSTTVRNSLLVASTNTAEVMCSEMMLTNNALEMDIAGNTSLGEMPD